MRLISPSGQQRRSLTIPALHEFVLKNDVENAKKCITNDVMAWQVRDANGMTPLMVAATLNRTDILQILVTSKCDVNETDNEGNTALHLAVDEGNTEVVRKLVHCGRCILDATNARGETALMRAAFYDYSEAARILLKEGSANPDIKNKNGQTALLIALQEGSQVTADLLLKSGCDVMIVDDLGRSAFYMSIHSPCIRSLDIAKCLIATGYNVTGDKMWLLNEEKHNLFYQDDAFYADLRHKLRHNSLDNNNNNETSSLKKVPSVDAGYGSSTSPNHSPRTSVTSSPTFEMSPTVKERIMSTDTSKFTPIPFSKLSTTESIDPKSPTSSPLHAKRSLYHNIAMYPSWSKPLPALHISSDSDESPIASPVSRDNMTSSPMLPSPMTLELKPKERRTGVSSPVIRQKFIKSASEGCSSAPVSPIIKYKRQISAQPTRARAGSHSDLCKDRKTSLPAKPVVQFSTEIQIFEIKRK